MVGMVNDKKVNITNLFILEPSGKLHIGGDKIESVRLNLDALNVIVIKLRDGDNILTTCPVTMKYAVIE